MIYTGYPINQFHKIGNKGFSPKVFKGDERFKLEVAKNETLSPNVSTDIEDIISNLENGNKEAINVLENLGLKYSLTEYGNGYKIKFEQNGNKYTVAYNDESVKTEEKTSEVVEDEYNSKAQLEAIEAPKAPNTSDYLKEVTYSNGMKETLVDEVAYENALQDYYAQRAEYEQKIYEVNSQTAQKQRQDIINDMQEELDSFNQSISELQAELDSNGTNSKMMTNIIREFSAEYSKLVQRKTETKIKKLDNFVQNINETAPNPPSASFYETDEEYAEAMNVYTYQKFLYEKQQRERELKTQFIEKRIEKIDEKLAQIKNLLFGNTTLLSDAP